MQRRAFAYLIFQHICYVLNFRLIKLKYKFSLINKFQDLLKLYSVFIFDFH